MKTQNSYENLYWKRHDWRLGESITEEKMDNLENGVTIVASQIQDIIDSGGGGGGSSQPSVTIESVMYTIGIDGTNPPDDNAEWYALEDFAGARKGQWIWTRTTYSNGMKAYSVSYAGIDGEGEGSLTTTFRYAVSDNGSTIPSEENWQSEYFMPQKGQWFWVETTYSTGSVSYSASYVGTDGEDGTSITVRAQPYRYQDPDTLKYFTIVELSDNTILRIPDGSDGPQGTPGEQGYVHIAWADNITIQDEVVVASGFDISGGEGKAWMGIYTDNISDDSRNAEDYTWTKIQIEGVSYYLLCEPNVLPHDYSNQRITLRAKKVEGTSNPTNYSGYFRLVGIGANGESTGTQTSVSSTSTTAKTNYTFENLDTNFPNTVYFRAQLYSQNNYSGGIYLLDSQTIALMESEDAYTVLLDNENHSFPGTSSAAVQGSTTSINVLAYKGSTRKGVTIGTISAPSGIGVSISNNGYTNARVNLVINGTVSVPGTITIPFTVDGINFNKIFSYSIAFTSENGSAPTSMVQQYARHTSSSNYSTIPNDRWSTTYPTDTSQGNYVWTRMKLIWENGDETYTTPVLETGISSAIDKIKLLDESLDKEEIFNRLTNNGQDEGIFINENGEYYINASYVKSGTLDGNVVKAKYFVIVDNENTPIAQFYKDEITLGNENEAHAEIDYNSFKLINKSQEDYFSVGDYIPDSDTIFTETFIATGEYTDSPDHPEIEGETINVKYNIKNIQQITIDGTITDNYRYYNNERDTIYFIDALEEGQTIIVKYSTSDNINYFTFGTRATNSVPDKYSTTFGLSNKANYLGFACGRFCEATATLGFASGEATEATGFISHAEGYHSKASGEGTHAEGNFSEAKGKYSHAEGSNTKANGINSHAEGYYTTAEGENQHVFGKYNQIDNSSTYVEIVGKGTSARNLSNARTLDWNGNETLAGSLTLGSPLTYENGGTGCNSYDSFVSLIQSISGGSGGANINFITTTTTKSDSLSLSSGNSLVTNTINIIAIRGGTTGSNAITIAGKNVRKNYSTNLIAAIPVNFILEAYYDGTYLYALNLPATF